MAKSDPSLRAARHHALANIGEAGQDRIAAATVLLIGIGGIGCAAASYLASAGVGRMLLVDFDTVDASNLGRQILFGPGDIGQPKASVAAAVLGRRNPDIEIEPITDRLSDHALAEAVQQSDLVLDGCDNFATRFQVNEACVASACALVSGAAIRLEGQLAVFGPDYPTSPCYRCLYREADESLDNCAGNGVLGPVPGVVGAMMATEALKVLAGIAGDPGRLCLYDALAASWQTISIGKQTNCPVCAS